MKICENCGAEHQQPNIDYFTTVPTSRLREMGEIEPDKYRVCGHRSFKDGGSVLTWS